MLGASDSSAVISVDATAPSVATTAPSADATVPLADATERDTAEPPAKRQSRRAVAVVNYSDKFLAGPRTADLIVAELVAAGSSVDSEGAASAAMDLPKIAMRLAERAKAASGSASPNFSAVRQSLIGLLRSGRVRRRLTVGELDGEKSTQVALGLLVLNTLQVEPDHAAPWSLRPRETTMARGAALVGRRVEVWWEKSGKFFSARVSGYDEAADGVGSRRLHTLVFDVDGLTSTEDLEGPGEPALWRLLDVDVGEEAPADGEADAAEGGAGTEEAEGGGAAASGAAETVWPQPVLEQMHSLATIRNQLPVSEAEASTFATPPGWTTEEVPGSRRPKVRWVQRDDSGSVRRSFERRHDLEEALEREAATAGGAWLGQLGGGFWEIRPKAVAPALGQVLKGLVASGLVCAVPSQVSGKNQVMYMISNRYLKGEPFPRKERAEKKEEEEKEELCDLELERQRNIARNQELLRMLGLA